MMKPRTFVLLLMLSAACLAPGLASAADQPATTVPATTAPSATDPAVSDTGADTAPLTLDQSQIDALNEAAGQSTDQGRSTFEKASDFVTENAPWFIIGIIVLAAIIAGILIMRGRPRKGPKGVPQASRSSREMRDAGGLAGREQAAPASASERRRLKRAAIQRSREEERMRRRVGIEGRQIARQGGVPAASPVSRTTAPASGLDPVEAEKQGARDQQTAAAAVARYGGTLPQTGPVPAAGRPGQAVPAPVSPSQTAPAAGVITPALAEEAGDYPVASSQAEAPVGDAELESYMPLPPEAPEPPGIEPAAGSAYDAATSGPAAETEIVHQPSLESPAPDAAVGNAARAFLVGGAAGAAGGLAAARAGRPTAESAVPDEPEDPVIAPEPGMAPEYAVAEPLPTGQPPAADPAAAVDPQVQAKVDELKASQVTDAAAPAAGPTQPEPPAPEVPGSDTDLSPGLAAVERRLSENSQERDRTLRDAEERLRRVEQRAEDAERRAAFAERLAQLKIEESARERRLNEVVSGIDRAEERAREAEERAEAAERAAAAALEQSELRPAGPEAPSSSPEPEPTRLEVEPRPATPVTPVTPVTPAVPAASADPAPIAESEAGDSRREGADREGPEAQLPDRRGLFGGSAPGPSGTASDKVNLNSATFEQLREAGLSVTQATRILAYRERFGGYGSVDDLEKVPGFPSELIDSLRGRITI